MRRLAAKRRSQFASRRFRRLCAIPGYLCRRWRQEVGVEKWSEPEMISSLDAVRILHVVVTAETTNASMVIGCSAFIHLGLQWRDGG